MARSQTGLIDRPQDLGADHPWLGLAAYTEDASGYFFGRERESAEVFRLVRRETLTVLFGQSGLGKTSLLGAGLFPRLRQNDLLPVYIRLDFAEGSPELADQVLTAVAAGLDRHQIDAPRPESGQNLWEYFHRVDTDFWSPRNRLQTLVLVFDQFEEIFTLGRSSEDNQARTRRFLADLADLIENRAPDEVRQRLDSDPEAARLYSFDQQNYKVVFSLREDYLPQLESLAARIRSVMRNRLRLTRMDGLQALDVVLEPGGDLVDEDLANRLVQFVAGIGGDPVPEPKPAEELSELEVEPALLSVVCRELNTKRLQAGQRRITVDLLAGSQSAIINDFYERSLEDLPPGVRVLIEERLLTRSGYRDSVALEEVLEADGATWQVIETLVNRRLLRLEDRFGVRRVELTHDLLTEVIVSSRDRRREEERLAAEQQQADALRRKLWRARLAIGVFAVLFVFMIGAVFITVAARNQAKTALFRADRTKALANVRTGHHERGLGQWGEALLHYNRSLRQADTRAARLGLADAWDRFVPLAADVELESNLTALDISPDGRLTAGALPGAKCCCSTRPA